MTYSETFLKRIETSSSKKPTIPDYELKNPIDAEVFVTGIVLIADSYFQLKGKCVVTVNGAIVFDEQDSESFKDTTEIPIALTNKVLGRSSKIEFFVWNSIDSDTVALTANIKLSQNQDETFAAAKGVDRQIQKDDVSLFEPLFPLQARSAATYTQLIDMKGYKKLLIMLGKPVFNDLPSLVSSTFSNTQGAMFDGKLDTSAVTGLDTVERVMILEYAELKERLIVLNATWNPLFNAKTVTVRLAISVDGVNWTDEQTYNASSSTVMEHPINLQCPQKEVKFVRLRGTSTLNPSGSNMTIKDIYDFNSVGGSGSLAFEIKTSNEAWVELIPSSEFGTITSSSNDVVRQVGDVTTVSVSGKTYALPSTQTRFRAKYVVSGGGLTNLVDIYRVA